MIDVLWLEDKADELAAFNDQAYDNGINLMIYKTAADAEKTINLHPEIIDAAILDARGFNRSTSEQQSTSGMHNVMFLLRSKQIPFVIFSGEVGILSNEEFLNSIGEAKTFKKGSDEDSVLQCIKDIVANLPNVKIKKENASAFKIFSNSIVSDLFEEDRIYEFQQTLIKLIQNRNDTDSVAKNIRSLYESFIFPLFEELTIIDSVDSFGVMRSYNSKAIALEHRNTQYKGKEYISKMACMVALFSQPLNHGKLQTEAGKYLYRSGNKFYLSCLVEGMLAVMTWLPELINNN